MTYLSTIGRVAAAAALVAGVIAAPSAALASPTQQFHANSGDNCRYGQTDGELTWHAGTPTTVEVTGTVIDRPVSGDSGTACRDDGLRSTAHFTAYYGDTVVDAAREQVDNGRLDFRLRLGANSTIYRISHVVVQVCRGSATSAVPVYCGAAQRYTPNTTTP